jgi:hypothetical protein
MRLTSGMILVAVLGVLPIATGETSDIPFAFVFDNANSRPTYFSVHGIGAAQKLSKGRGIRVGILDHYFGTEVHPELYSGSANFLGNDAAEKLTTIAEHGYWMAKTLREIAPEVEIFALNAASRDESQRADAISRAVDWAIEHDLDILTHSHRKFSIEAREVVDAAVARAHEAGVVTVFIHYGHPENLLPGGLFPSLEDGRQPDVFVLHYDYSVLFTEWYAELQETGKSTGGYTPFLSISSTAPVTAGVVAMMRSQDPSISPARCREILRSTARPMTFEGKDVPRALDAAAAVEMAAAEKRGPLEKTGAAQ